MKIVDLIEEIIWLRTERDDEHELARLYSNYIAMYGHAIGQCHVCEELMHKGYRCCHCNWDPSYNNSDAVKIMRENHKQGKDIYDGVPDSLL